MNVIYIVYFCTKDKAYYGSKLANLGQLTKWATS